MNLKPKLCPFCKKDNKCKVSEPKSCWCMNIKVPAKLRDLVPSNLKMKSCICQNCIESFIKDEKQFIEKYKLI